MKNIFIFFFVSLFSFNLHTQTKLEKLLTDLQSFEYWANAKNEKLAGLPLGSSNDLKMQSQKLNKLVVNLQEEIKGVENYWGQLRDTIYYEGLLCRISIFDEKTEMMRAEGGLFQSSLLEYHDLVINHEKKISAELKVAQDQAAQYRQLEAQYNANAVKTKNRQEADYYFLMALEESTNASYQEATISVLAPQVANSQQLLKTLNDLEVIVPEFRTLISNIHSNNISIRENANKTSNATNVKVVKHRRNQLKNNMMALFNYRY